MLTIYASICGEPSLASIKQYHNQHEPALSRIAKNTPVSTLDHQLSLTSINQQSKQESLDIAGMSKYVDVPAIHNYVFEIWMAYIGILSVLFKQ